MVKQAFLIINEKIGEPSSKIKASSLSSAAKVHAKRQFPDLKKGKRTYKIHVMKEESKSNKVKVVEVIISKLDTPKETQMKDGKVIKVSKEISTKVVDTYTLKEVPKEVNEN